MKETGIIIADVPKGGSKTVTTICPNGNTVKVTFTQGPCNRAIVLCPETDNLCSVFRPKETGTTAEGHTLRGDWWCDDRKL
jgi:hypothetical protein